MSTCELVFTGTKLNLVKPSCLPCFCVNKLPSPLWISPCVNSACSGLTFCSTCAVTTAAWVSYFSTYTPHRTLLLAISYLRRFSLYHKWNCCLLVVWCVMWCNHQIMVILASVAKITSDLKIIGFFPNNGTFQSQNYIAHDNIVISDRIVSV